MKQPDDPGTPGTPLERHFERQVREKNKRDRWRYWGLVLAMALIVMTFVFLRTADAQDPPVPLEQPCPSAADCTIYNQAFIFALTGDERMIRWSLAQNDVDTMELFTELQIFEFPPKGAAFPVMRAELPEVERAFGWTPNRAGTYFVKARACRIDILQDGEPIEDEDNPGEFFDPELRRGTLDQWILCSILIESLDPAHTDPTVFPRGFVLFIKLAPATGGGIS